MLIGAGVLSAFSLLGAFLWGRSCGEAAERRAWISAVFTARADNADDAKVGQDVTQLAARVARQDGWP